MTGPVDGVPRGNPAVMTYDPKGNAVIDPREDEKDTNAAAESERSNDAKEAARTKAAGKTARRGTKSAKRGKSR